MSLSRVTVTLVRTKWIAAAFAVVCLCSSQWVAAEEPATKAGPLASYVAAKDASYGWVQRREGKVGATRWYELTLTSQTWMEIPWKHQLFVIRPSKLGHGKQGLLLIAGGRWRDDSAGPVDPAKANDLPKEAQLLAVIAERLQSPIAILLQVPHQPIFEGRVEDQIIAYTFDRYLSTKNEQWPLLLPMVNSAVRAMDAVQEFARQDWQLEVTNFTVTGASKRGWTTWLTGAVDPRVNAIAPMVIDVLNMPAQMKHQLDTWGKYSEQIEDYTRLKIPERTDSPEGRRLNAIVDPYSYREALTQPKLVILATNDRYWPVDALNVYWQDLPGEKHILYVPNNPHGIQDLVRVMGSLSALHLAAAGEAALPKLEWELKTEGKMSLKVTSDRAPERVVCWVATSASKDFRESKWESFAATQEADGSYSFSRELPATGYAAFFGEAVFAAEAPLYLSTNLRVVGAAETKE